MKRILFYTIRMGDVEDPEIYAAGPMYDWQQTDQGRWVMENCADPCYRIQPDPGTLGFRIEIYGDLEDKQATEFLLRWNQEQY